LKYVIVSTGRVILVIQVPDSMMVVYIFVNVDKIPIFHNIFELLNKF
jgi:hypothetical protein